MVAFLEPPKGEWEYFNIASIRDVHFIDHGQNEFELVILASIAISFLLSSANTDVIRRRVISSARL